MTLLLSAAAACAARNPPPIFAYDHSATFAGLRTWAWLDDPTSKIPSGSAIVDGAFIDRHVRQDVRDDLAKKGLTETGNGRADIYVAYSADNAGVSSQDSFEKTDATSFLAWSWDHLEYAGTQYSKRTALVLDIRDSQRKLVWRGSRTAPEGTNPEEFTRDIRTAVNRLLAEFPPGPSTKPPAPRGLRPGTASARTPIAPAPLSRDPTGHKILSGRNSRRSGPR